MTSVPVITVIIHTTVQFKRRQSRSKHHTTSEKHCCFKYTIKHTHFDLYLTCCSADTAPGAAEQTRPAAATEC